MWFERNYQDLVKRTFDFGLQLLYPWKTDKGQEKLSKLFSLFLVSHVILLLVLLTYVLFEWDTLSLKAIMENSASALVVLRSSLYILLVLRFHGAYKKQLDALHNDRTNLPLDQNERQMTNNLYRREFKILVSFILMFGISGWILIHVFAYFFPNEKHLTYDCYIFFMPPERSLLAWELNCLFIVVTSFNVVLFFMWYVPIPLMLMNQTRWLLDMALMTAERLNEDLQPDDEVSDQERIERTNDHLKQFVERCEKFVEWRNEVQELLSWNFELEFRIQSFILCISIYYLSLDFAASFIVQNLFWVCLIQLFVYCWMGTRVTNQINQLSFEISHNWHLMPIKQRKAVQMILHWTQNMNGFTGTFKEVSVETFQAILEASYSFYAFLRSSNE